MTELYATVAQQVEQLTRNEQVVRSNRISSSKKALEEFSSAFFSMTGIPMLCGESPPRRSYRRTQKRLASFTL